MNRQLLRSAFVAAALVCMSAADAEPNWPSHPIRLVVPLGAGSAVDVAARIVAGRMSIGLGQQIVVDNVVGAAGLVGADKVAKAPADGYTIGGFNDAIMTMLPALQPKLPWDILRDFTPISLVATVEWCLVASPGAKFATAGDLIKAAKAAPGGIDFGSGGIGSPQQIAMALFASEAHIELNHVPYKGAAQLAVGLAGNEVPVAFQGLASVNSLVKGHRLKLLGVSTTTRMSQYPNVPTIAESGLPGFVFDSWFTLMAPAGTPPAIVERLNAEVRKVLADPAIREQLAAQGLTARGSSPEELGRMTRVQLDKYSTLIRQAGIKAE